MTVKHRVCVRWIWVSLGMTGVLIGVMLFWLLRPYDLVRVADGDGLATPPVVEQGGTVTVTRDFVCNDGVDVDVHRWADSISADGKVAASFDLGVIRFFANGESGCFAPSVTGVTLPNYVIGPDGGPGKFRLRWDLSYRPNPIRVVTVSTTTTEFTVVPAGTLDKGE